MKDSRIGESLWFIWDTDNQAMSDGLMLHTEGHVDVEHEVVRRALASALQREGIALSLSQGFMMIDRGEITHGYAGTSEEDSTSVVSCDADGDNPEDLVLENIVPTTWVKVYDF
jgi:hypothetical protein